MTAEYLFDNEDDADAELRLVIREELLAASKSDPEVIMLAARLPVGVLAQRMDISLVEAFALRKAARKWICDAWNFEDMAGMRAVLWAGDDKEETE